MDFDPRTIVGGRSAAYRNLSNFPRGIEILLKKAKVDDAFQRLVLENPITAANEIDLNLTASEKKILTTTSKTVLRSMIDNTFVPKQHIKTFLMKSSAAMLALILGSSVIIPTPLGATGQREEDVSVFHADVAREKMRTIQDALEQYREDHGTYPLTEEWLTQDNPLDGYIALPNIQDPWKRKFRYQGVKDQTGKVVNYLLESLGTDVNDLTDNISCPIDTDKHSFVETHAPSENESSEDSADDGEESH